MKHELPQLPYSYDALEPSIDAKTMEVHHGKHHLAYTDKMNAVLEKYPVLAKENPEDLIRKLNELDMDEQDRTMLKNHGGGYINHNLFWKILGPKKEVDQSLLNDVTKTFGSCDMFKQEFGKAALSHFGSGWAWLVRDDTGALKIYSLPNQDSPLTKGHTPLIALDVWEHAYYLKYQNRRQEYIENWWHVLRLL